MSHAPLAASPRISWDDVPRHVRAAVDQGLGSPITSAVTQQGGFSPGAAVRVVCEDGRRAFVKAVGRSLNPDSPGLHRREIQAMSVLPDGVPAPRLLSSYDDGDWVALVLEDVAGRRPDLPWQGGDVDAMSVALGHLARTRAPEQLPVFADNGGVLTSWDQVTADPEGIGSALLHRLPEMLAAQFLAREVTPGDALVHWDARADNVLIRAGKAVLLDWAWASRGAPWLDSLLLAMDFRIQGGPDPDDFLHASAVTREVEPTHLRAVVACMVGVWADYARRPPPRGLPTIRSWQANCRDHAQRWLDDGALWS
jgi:aminoglycoside phosphotransferase (APT) family kinase protein